MTHTDINTHALRTVCANRKENTMNHYNWDGDSSPDESLTHYEVEHHMNPGEKRALHYWLACGHSAADTPPSRYLKACGIPDGWDFLDVYRLEKELDADTAGMDSLQKEYYLRKYFGEDIGLNDPVQEKSSLHEEHASDRYSMMKRKLSGCGSLFVPRTCAMKLRNT